MPDERVSSSSFPALRAADLLEVLEDEGVLLAAVARGAGLGAAIPTCAPWTMRDLLAHLTHVYRWVALTVGEERAEPPSRTEREALGRSDRVQDDPVERLRSAHADLVSTLRRAPADLRCWTPWPAPAARTFWIRRQVHETLVHRVDAQNGASGDVCDGHDLTPAVAADGVDELVRGFLNWFTDSLRAARPVTLALHSLDTGDRWWIRIGPDAPRSGRGGPPVDLPVTEVFACAGELLLLLWNRRGADGLDVHGDRAVLEAWHRGARR